MKKLLFLAASLAVATVAFVPLAYAQDFTGGGFQPAASRNTGDSGGMFTDSRAGTGDYGRTRQHDTQKNWDPGNYQYQYRGVDRHMEHNRAEDPDTLKTNTQNYLQMTRQGRFGPGMDETSTSLLAPQSFNQSSFPSGKYKLGFPDRQSAPGGGGPWIPSIGLPTTSTGSVDLDITNGYN